MIVFDFNHMAYRMLFTAMKQFKDGNFDFMRHLFFTSMYYVMDRFEDGKVVVAVDRGSWRKKYYEDYKAGRKEGRDESPIDFDAFFQFANQLVEELNKLPLAVISVKYAEADDSFGVIAQNTEKIIGLADGEKIVFASSDKDMHQVKRHCECIVYDPIKKEELWKGASKTTMDHALEVKLITGDMGDNISQIEKGIGPGRAAKIIATGLDEWLDAKPERRKIYYRNDVLINFDNIPPTIQEVILETLNAQLEKANKIRNDPHLFPALAKYYQERGLNRLYGKIEDHLDLFKKSFHWTGDTVEATPDLKSTDETLQAINELLGVDFNVQ